MRLALETMATRRPTVIDLFKLLSASMIIK